MKTPEPSTWTGLVVLAGLLTIALLLPHGVLTGVIVALLLALLASELDRSGRHVALRIVTVASRLLPRPFRSEYAHQWRDHVLVAGEHGVRPVIVAASIVRGAITLAFRLRMSERIASQVTNGLLALCNAIDADGRQVRRWAVTLATPEGPGVYDSVANAELEGSDEQEDLRGFLNHVPGVWLVSGAVVSVGSDDDISVITVGDAIELGPEGDNYD